VACPARRTDRSLAYFLVPSAHQWLARIAGRSAHRLTSSFLPLVSGLPSSPDGSLIGLLPRSFRSSVACPARRTERSSAYFLVSSARQWLAQLAGRIAHRLTSSFLPLISGLRGLPDGTLISLLARFFRWSVACPARRTDHSSAYFLVSSTRQWIAQLAGRIAHRLTSLFLLFISGLPGSPDGVLISLLPRFFRSSVACPGRRTDRSSAYFLVPSAHQWLARLAGHSSRRLTSSFLPVISVLPSSPDRSLIGLLPRFFRSSVDCPARRTDRSSAYFLVPSVHQWLDRLAGRSAHRLTSLFLLLVSGLRSSPDGSLIGLLPCSFCSSVAFPARRTDRLSAYLFVSSAGQWLAQLAGQIAHWLTSVFLLLISGFPGSPDGSLHPEKKKLRPERPDALDALDASDATCLTRTQFAMALCIRTQLAMASAYRTERVRAFSFWTQPCQGIFLLDAAVSGHFPSGRCRVRANGVWTTRVMAPRSRWLSRHGTSQQILLSHSQTRSGFQA